MSRIALTPNASGTGTLTIAAPNTNTDRTLTLPDTTGTIVMNEGSGIFKIDSSGKVGIGTSSPAEELHLQAAAPALRLQDSDDSAYTNFIQNSGGFRIDVDPTAAGANSFFRVDVDATERMRIDSLGRVGIGTSSPSVVLDVVGSAAFSTTGATQITLSDSDGGFAASKLNVENGGRDFRIAAPQDIIFETGTIDRARFDPSGTLFIGKSSSAISTPGFEFPVSGAGYITADNNAPLLLNRETADGQLIQFRQDNVQEGNISVSGTTVSYNGGHLSRWAQLPDNSRPELLKGTVMSNLDQMSNWDGEDNEQLNCVQVSTVEGDANVAGVFVAWDSTEDDYNDILLAMTGDMVIRIGAGVTVARGDLLMSAGDGTAKPQGDDIVRSKTIAKVTSTHVSHTYADGSYAVPCVLMAC